MTPHVRTLARAIQSAAACVAFVAVLGPSVASGASYQFDFRSGASGFTTGAVESCTYVAPQAVVTWDQFAGNPNPGSITLQGFRLAAALGQTCLYTVTQDTYLAVAAGAFRFSLSNRIIPGPLGRTLSKEVFGGFFLLEYDASRRLIRRGTLNAISIRDPDPTLWRDTTTTGSLGSTVRFVRLQAYLYTSTPILGTGVDAEEYVFDALDFSQ